MERLLLFTAGTSLLENLKDPGKFGQRGLVDALCYREANAWHSVLRRAQGIRNEVVDFARLFSALDLEDIASRSWATAELAGLYLLRREQEESADRLVLLCSDTGEGAFCALANGMLLGQEVLYDSPSGETFTLPGMTDSEAENGFHPTLMGIRLPQVELVIVDKLNPTQPGDFERRAIPALVRAIAQAHYNRHPEAQTVLNYTGGFKAAIPTLTQAAAIAGNIELVCLYEDGLDLVHLPLVQIMLRREAEERLIWSGEKAGTHPDPLRDYPTLDALKHHLCREEWAFYEEAQAGGLQPSSLGMAMRELLRARDRWASIDR